MITETDCIQLAVYLIKTNQLKKLTETQIKIAFSEFQTKLTTSSQKASEDAQFDFEMDLLEDILKQQ